MVFVEVGSRCALFLRPTVFFPPQCKLGRFFPDRGVPGQHFVPEKTSHPATLRARLIFSHIVETQ